MMLNFTSEFAHFDFICSDFDHFVVILQPADSRDTTGVVDNGVMQDESPLSIVPTDNVSSQQMETLELQIKEESAPNVPGLLFDNASTLQLVESSANTVEMNEFYAREAGALQKRNLIPLENPKDMITRWYADTFDLTTIVKDALHAGRLPLAVLQLHLQHQKELGSEEPHDTFSEVCDIGKNIAYDLFLKVRYVILELVICNLVHVFITKN